MLKKRLPSGCGCSSGVDMFTAEDLEVADVLYRLPGLIRKSESARRLPFLWGAKRRRSALDAPPSSSASLELLPVSGKLDYASNSPNSPLVFSSLADFDSKHAVPNKNSSVAAEFKEGKAMELLIDDQLVAGNTKMQDTRQLCAVSLELKLFSKSEPSDPHRQQEAPVGPMGMIPDLNVPAEAYAVEQLHHQVEYLNHQAHHHYQLVAAAKSRAEAAALARHRRHLIQKSKKATRGRR